MKLSYIYLNSLFLFSIVHCIQSQKLEDLDYSIRVGDKIYYEQWLDRNQWKYGQFNANNHKDSVLQFVPNIIGMPIASYRNGTGSNWKVESYDKTWTSPDYKPYKHYLFDFWLQPDFQFRFGNFENPVESKGGLSIYHQIPIKRGLSLFAGLHIPIKNDFDEQPLNFRPAATYFNYFKSLRNYNYLNIAVGYFLGDRYGYKIQYIKSPLDQSWSWGVENSLTGYLYFYPKSLKYTPLDDLVLIGHLAYRLKKEDIIFKLTGGQFLHRDKGARLEIIRQFSKAEVSLFSLFSQNGSTIGIDLAFRIPPGKIIQNQKFRLRTGNEYPFQYIYSSGYSIAENFRLLTDMDRMLRQFNSNYWINESNRIKGK